jgi:ATP-dependent exoDNAse (exonuclease V) alpha subunit
MTQSQALAIMKTGANVFLTGEPGSGKTHIVNQYVDYLRSCGIEPAITASTGIAATHIGGMTIHSWSGTGIKAELTGHDLNLIASNERLTKRINAAKVLIIDEISMLPPNTLNMVEAVCRRVRRNAEPFGGLQVIFVGDFFQLPPIVKNQYNQYEENSQESLLDNSPERFAYDSAAWQRAKPIVCYLHEQYRQDDKNFLSLLTAIRANNFQEDHLAHLRQRQINYPEAPDNLPKLYSHNIDVDRVNSSMLAKLPAKSRTYDMHGQGPKHLVETLKRGCLSPEKLELKIGASVMFTKNSLRGSFANGTLGTVDSFDSLNGYPIVRLRNGTKITVEPGDWMLEDRGEVLARITQLPLRLAWAITVHKSQGMSLDGAVMDLSSVFEFGQGYVALSRVRSLSGLFLLGWNNRAFEVSPEVVMKDKDFKTASENHLSSFSEIMPEVLAVKHDDFIRACGGQPGQMVVRKNSLANFFKKPKINTRLETLKLWREGKDFEAIVKLRQLAPSTILEHLEKLGEQGKIRPEEFNKLASDDLIEALSEIHQAFSEIGAEKLSPIFNYFEGQHSYEDLRLARMMLGKKKKFIKIPF